MRRRAACGIFLAVCLLYLSFPTSNYYWDGIAFAQDIEQAPAGPWFLHPNHLLYSPLGRELWSALNALGIEIRAHTVLRLLSAATGAAAAALMFIVLLDAGLSAYVAACLSAFFAFSATWWKFATDADSYVPVTFLLILCFWLLVRPKRSSSITVGLVHAAAMALHQLAVFFYFPAVVGLWLRNEEERRTRRLAEIGSYSLAAGTPLAALYLAAFLVRSDSPDVNSLAGWIVSYSPEAAFSFDLPRNLWASILGTARLVVGGDLGLVLEQRSPVSLVAAAALVVSVALLASRLVRQPPEFGPILPGIRRILPVLAVWAGVYIAFLFFWLPQNTFYRLFYLPPLYIAAAGFLDGPRTTYRRLALAAGALFLLNFGFHIYPHSPPETNRSLQIAAEMRSIWSPGDTVYWDVFTSENRTIRYFNPDVEWKELWGRAWISQLEDSLARDGSVWIDSVAFGDYLRRDPELASWLNERSGIEERYEFPIGHRTVGFVKLGKSGKSRTEGN